MTALAISAPTRPGSSSSREQVTILPRQQTSSAAASGSGLSSYGSASDFTSPESFFDFEELVEVDELLTDLGMSPPMPTYDYGYDGAGVTAPTAEDLHDIQQVVNSVENSLLPPFQPSISAPWLPTSEASEAYSNGVVRTVSLDQVLVAASSVPNPMRSIPLDEPRTKKNKVYTPLLPTPTTSTSAISSINSKLITPATTAANKKISTLKKTPSKPTIAKSSSIPSLLPSAYLSTAPSTSTQMMHSSTSSASLGRKRKFSRKEAELNMSAEELEGRRERNRSHAKKSRQRKKAITELLQESIQSLQQTNQILRASLDEQLGPQYSEQFLQNKQAAEKQSFLDALRNPKNRIVDAAGLTFLKKLQKRIPSDNDDIIND
ncbi:MAG: hypothetical protein SGBAC_011853 [Bacillariaceae sp.]